MSNHRVADLALRGLAPAGVDASQLQLQLDQCRAELLALQREQETFAHGISHDLRAPLRAIDSFSALVEGNASLDDPARAHLARIRAAASRMGGLIDALLELSRVNRAELNPQTIDLGLLVEWVGAELQEAEPHRTAQIQAPSGLLVRGDERLLKSLVGQLLHNAWKFSRERDCVNIQVSGEPAVDRLRVRVRDAGCGFDMRYVHKVFEPFQRLIGPEHGGGHGIGLAIAKRIVERHGGQLQAQSEPGIGSSFEFDLPAEPIAAAMRP